MALPENPHKHVRDHLLFFPRAVTEHGLEDTHHYLQQYVLQILIQKKKNILDVVIILMNKTRKTQQQLETDSSGEKESLYRKPKLEHFLAALK